MPEGRGARVFLLSHDLASPPSIAVHRTVMASREDRAGARTLGERLVEDHGDAVWAMAVRLVGPQAAEDVVQETLLAAVKADGTFAGKSAERTWLLGILNHKAADHFRARARTMPTGPSVDPVRDFAPSGKWLNPPKRWPGGDEADRASLNRCIERLPNILRDAVELRDVREVSSEGVCQVLGISPTNLWQRLHRARLALRRCLEAALARAE